MNEVNTRKRKMSNILFELPQLHQKDKQGRIKVWKVCVEDQDGVLKIITEHGLMDGNLTRDAGVVVKAGKNIGRANETDPLTQAKNEAQSLFELKCSKGYVEDLSKIDEVVLLPMLANKWPGRKKYIKFPAIVQRKYDGVRCLMSYDPVRGRAMAISRLGNEFPHLDHIRVQANHVLSAGGYVLDGELYSEDLDFNTLVGLVKRHTLEPEDQQKMLLVKYRVYDGICTRDPDRGFIDRYNDIRDLIQGVRPDERCHIDLVENFELSGESNVLVLHSQFVSEGYEGAIIRNRNGKYAVNHRSNDLLKYKQFDAGIAIRDYE